MITPPPNGFQGLFYQEFLSVLVQKRRPNVYLEIGVQKGINLANIHAKLAIGIDPEFQLTVDPTVNKEILQMYRMGSDEFFARYSPSAQKVDFAFLDGMHLFEFLLRDFYNVEKICHRNSIILMHDCLPYDDFVINRTFTNAAWTGDVWKTVDIIQRFRPDLHILYIDAAPTGLVAITNIDPTSTVLEDNYMSIVKEYAAMPNDWPAVEAFYANKDLVSASAILNEDDHTLYFRA